MNKTIIILITSLQVLPLATNASSPLGKTHFIVGYDKKELPTTQHRPSLQVQAFQVPFNLLHNDEIKAVYFSPGDNVHSVLEYLIEQEQKSIRVAMFAFTDKKIAHALINAHNRGIHIELITDASSVYGKYNKLSVLHGGKVPVYVYNAARVQPNNAGIMHNKFFLFEKNILEKSVVWTGSFNATVAGSRANRENVIVSEEQLYIKKFTKEFQELKSCCDRYQEPISMKQSADTK